MSNITKIYQNGRLYKEQILNNGVLYIQFYKKDSDICKYPYKVICYNFYYDEKHNDIKFINYFDENNCLLKKELYKDNKIIDVIKKYRKEDLREIVNFYCLKNGYTINDLKKMYKFSDEEIEIMTEITIFPNINL